MEEWRKRHRRAYDYRRQVGAGIPLKEDLVELVLGSADFERMQELETEQQQFGAGLINSDPSIRFVRSGRVGEAKQYFDQDMLSDFLTAHCNALCRMGNIEQTSCPQQ